MYTIYKITNLINQKCYIGQTKNSLTKRFRGHKSSKSTMYHVIKKYGADNFSIKPIDYAENRSDAIKKEAFWTIFFKSNEPDYGYNKAVGSGGLYGEKNPFYGKHHTPESLEKISGSNHWTTRKSFSDESLQKKHDALYRKPSGRSKPVRCVETGEVLPFAKEFYYKYGYQDSKILECCKGRRNTHRGFHWEYAS